MANELKLNGYTTGLTLYAFIESPAGQLWRTDTNVFENFTTGNIANYVVACPEQATGTGRYRGNFPTAIITSGKYNISIYRQKGGSPAISDLIVGSIDIEWKGTGELSNAADINKAISTLSSPVTTQVSLIDSTHASITWTADPQNTVTPTGSHGFYRIMRTADHVTYTQVGTVNNNVTLSFTDTLPVANVSYYYTVTSVR